MIPFFDYRRELATLRAQIDAAVARVLDSGRLVLGPEVEAFESEFAAWVGTRHAIGVNSGTDALMLALRALDAAGGEVVTVANAGSPPVAAIRAAGARPVMVEVDPETLSIDPSACRAALTPNTRAILAVHLYGQPVAIERLGEIAEDAGVPLVEDCAQAHGTTVGGRRAGSLGVVAAFSFYPTKNLGAFGDGGAVTTDDERIAARIRSERCYGWEDDRVSRRDGLNSRLDELQAALLRIKLRGLDAAIARRRQIAARYREALAAAVRLPRVDDGHAYHLFVARHPGRDALIARLGRLGVQCAVHYADPCHTMPAFEAFGRGAGSLPQTEAACAECFSLPMFFGLTDEEIERVIAALAESV